MKKTVRLLCLPLILLLALVACQPETIVEQVEVTRVVTETEIIEGEAVEVTRVVTETETIVEEVVEVVEVEVLANRGHLNVSDDYSFGLATTMDPHDPNRFFRYVHMAYNTLIEKDVDGSLIPSLAVSWEPNDDGSEWTIGLRDGVLFHDGSAMTGEDVAYSLLRLTDPEVNSPLLASFGTVQAVEVVDDLTIVVSLDPANVDFPELLTAYQAAVIRDGGGETIAEDGIGTGPFALVSLDAAGITEMVAFDDYWDGPPKSASASIIAISDNEARLQAMLAGQIDFAAVGPDQAALFENNNDFQIQVIPGGGWAGMVMRTDTAPFDDARVRLAIRLAADRDEILANTLNGLGVVSCDHPVWTGDIYRADIDCSQDIPRAIELLAEAGYPDGIDIDVHTSPLNAEWTAFLETYQSQALEAGIRLNIIQAPSDGYWSETWLVESNVMTAWGERPAGQILNEAYRGGVSWNETYYNNPEFDALLDQAASETDLETRIEIYAQLQNILWEDGGSLIPYHRSNMRVVSSCLAGLQPNGQFWVKYENIVKAEDC